MCAATESFLKELNVFQANAKGLDEYSESSGGVADMVADIGEIVVAANGVCTFTGLAATECIEECTVTDGATRLLDSPAVLQQGFATATGPCIDTGAGRPRPGQARAQACGMMGWCCTLYAVHCTLHFSLHAAQYTVHLLHSQDVVGARRIGPLPFHRHARYIRAG